MAPESLVLQKLWLNWVISLPYCNQWVKMKIIKFVNLVIRSHIERLIESVNKLFEMLDSFNLPIFPFILFTTTLTFNSIFGSTQQTNKGFVRKEPTRCRALRARTTQFYHLFIHKVSRLWDQLHVDVFPANLD